MHRVSIVQGEHHVAAAPGIVISTLLGSCVAVCLQDPVARVGGMNHFLLSEPGCGEVARPEDQQRYGIHSMELLINAMMAQGASRRRLRAHLYGGATIIAGLGNIGRSNAAFARRFVADEGIELGRCELEGTQARKIEFMPYEGRVRSIPIASAPAIVKPAAPVVAGGDVELF